MGSCNILKMKAIIFALLLVAFTHARLFKTTVEEMRLNEENLDEDYSWYTQRLDHFNPQVNATWQQRYYDTVVSVTLST